MSLSKFETQKKIYPFNVKRIAYLRIPTPRNYYLTHFQPMFHFYNP